MFERLHHWVGYVGSAALVAFLGTCLDAPRVATFTCDTSPGASEERCELSETLAAAGSAHDDDRSDETGQVAIALNAMN